MSVEQQVDVKALVDAKTLTSLSDFVYQKTLACSAREKTMTVLGYFQSDCVPALLLASDSGVLVPSQLVILKIQTCTPTPESMFPTGIETLQLELMSGNNEYSQYRTAGEKYNELKIDMIYPAQSWQILKNSESTERMLVRETATMYAAVTHPFVQTQITVKKLQWVYDLLDGTHEADRMLYYHQPHVASLAVVELVAAVAALPGLLTEGEAEVVEEELVNLAASEESDAVAVAKQDDDSFMIHPDSKWLHSGFTHSDPKDTTSQLQFDLADADVVGLYCRAICQRRDIHSLRDLNASHLPLLQAMHDESVRVMEEKYGVPEHQLQIFVHYVPSFYHFHVHIVHVCNDAINVSSGHSHSLTEVINNIALCGTYYQQSLLCMNVPESHSLHTAYGEYFHANGIGISDTV
jgi:hypothetical protein